jgi:beta-lactamase superfamily II metal-dependent hydrolase
MFCIKHGSDSFTIIDCCLSEDNQDAIVQDLKDASKDKGITRFMSTHPDEDHLVGLSHLDEEMGIVNFYCIKNKVTKEDESDDFQHYCKLRDSEKAFFIYRGVGRKWLNETDDTRGGAGIRVEWPVVENKDYKEALNGAEAGDSPNNVSAVLRYSLKDGATFMWMGDLETAFMEKIADSIKWPRVDILFAPHHGRHSGRVPHAILDKIKPKIIVLGEAPSRHLNYYGGYEVLTQNSAGDIVFECESNKVHIFVSEESCEVNYLDNEYVSGDGHYLGTLNL